MTAEPSGEERVVDRLRAHSAIVASTARTVDIDQDRIESYAADLAAAIVAMRDAAGLTHEPDPVGIAPAPYWLTLNAVNFGSGWFPTLRKRPGATGYRTIAAGVTRRFRSLGPWSAAELSAIGTQELGELLGQDPNHELIGLFAASLRDLGTHLDHDYAGSPEALVESVDGSAVRLVETLAGWNCFADTSHYEGLELPFLKRAQIAAADLQRAQAADFTDIEELTMFADNLVPHVLRLDGVLSFAPALIARIDREELIEHDSPEEIEIRACAVHAVELLVAAAPVPVTAAEVDEQLWNRGQGPAYKSRPRHRSRTTAY